MLLITLFFCCCWSAVGLAKPIEPHSDPNLQSTSCRATSLQLKRISKTTTAALRSRQEIGLLNIQNAILLADVVLGTQFFELIVDTGSSNTWVVGTAFNCVNPDTHKQLPQSACGFGTTYDIEDTFNPVPDENFEEFYPDGNYAAGIVGTDSMLLADITLASQEFGIANIASSFGSGLGSGLLGLGPLAYAYIGTDPTNDSSTNMVEYSPTIKTFFATQDFSLNQQKLSFAVSRDESDYGSGGILCFGDCDRTQLNDSTVNVTDINSFSRAPLVEDDLVIGRYSILVDSVSANTLGSGISRSEETKAYVMDSRTAFLEVARDFAAGINVLFDPPAYQFEGIWRVSCNATAPEINLVIGGVDFPINTVDLVLQQGLFCVSGVQSSRDPSFNVLGDTFFKNVVAVFDLGIAQEMRFASRPYYES